MKKHILKKSIFILITVIAIFMVIFLLNITVSTRQGINYQWHTIRIPLYLKILDFFDRHYNYKQLVQRIINDEHNKQKRVMKIFSWTFHNIRKQPENLPIIDDHVWHIIVRGYGVSDQSCDVFSTLCNYAGLDAFFTDVSAKGKGGKIRLSFVRVHNQWHIFDPYNGIYFVDTTDRLADITMIKSGNYRSKSLGPPKKIVLDYRSYFDNMPDIKEVGLKREKIQSPFKRFIYQVKKWID